MPEEHLEILERGIKEAHVIKADDDHAGDGAEDHADNAADLHTHIDGDQGKQYTKDGIYWRRTDRYN